MSWNVGHLACSALKTEVCQAKQTQVAIRTKGWREGSEGIRVFKESGERVRTGGEDVLYMNRVYELCGVIIVF